MHLRDNTKVFSIRCANRMDRTEACPRRICCFCSKKSFLHDGSISWQKSPVKILFARKVQNGEAKRFAFRHLAAGAKFSEFGHPFVCFADISPNRGITPPYPVKCISCVGNGLDRSATPPLVGEVARAKRVTEGQNTSKFTGGRGNPPLQRVVELRLRHYPFVAARHFP